MGTLNADDITDDGWRGLGTLNADDITNDGLLTPDDPRVPASSDPNCAQRFLDLLDRLLEGQWSDGMVPHIVFHGWNGDYFPGPEVWRTRHDPPTSGITQPAVLATAVRRCWESAQDKTLAEAHAAALYPRLLAWHRWWAIARDPDGTGLVGMLHPWESGMDNSPAWDVALAPVPTDSFFFV